MMPFSHEQNDITPDITANRGEFSSIQRQPADCQTPQKDTRTPVKSLAQGYYFHGHPCSRTPTARPHLGLLSGGACSPLLQTPGSVSRTSNLCRHKTPGSSRSTPKYTTPGGTSHRVKKNPFDSPGQIDSLTNHVFSPNCFKCTEPGSAEKTPTTFRWSIDQIAELKPADIEEMPIQQDTLNIRNPKDEAHAQEAINVYFSQKHVVPSPWSKPLPKHILPATPGSASMSGDGACASPMLQYLKETGRFKHIQEEPVSMAPCEVATQTNLTLPLDFDLQKVLGEHYISDDAEVKSMVEDTSPADLSSSSLRRKLFFHGDVGTPLSPVRSGRKGTRVEFNASSPCVSPIRDTKTPQHSTQPIIGAQFSSSPIRSGSGRTPVTPCLRRCSTAPNLETFDSPTLSPIHVKEDCDDDFALHHSADGPMQATPSPGQQQCRNFGLPDLSPIGNNGSYLASPDDNLGRDRAFASVSKREPPPPLYLPASPSPTHSPLTHQHMDLSGKDFNSSQVMEHDVSQQRTEFRLRLSPEDYDDGVSLISEKELSETEAYGSSCQSGGFGISSQDTGYHTESMQGGLQEGNSDIASGSHTNLTTQFGQLPLAGEQNTKNADANVDLQDRHQLSLQCDNASFEIAIPISSTQVRPDTAFVPLPKVSDAEPEFSHQMDLTVNRSQPNSVEQHVHPNAISRQTSLPEPLSVDGAPHPPSIPISISRQPSVSFELSDSIEQQVNNEMSPANNKNYLENLNEEEIILRARAVLGKDLQNSPEPQQQSLPVPGFPWYTDAAATPQRKKLSGLAKTLQRRQHDVNAMLPSEVAFEVLRKAGTDYDKVCSGVELDDTCHYEDNQHTDMSFTSG